MTRARARPLWLAGPALLAACSSSPSASRLRRRRRRRSQTSPTTTTDADGGVDQRRTFARPSQPPTTLVPVDPTQLIPVALGNKALPADADELATLHQGYTGDPNATLQTWLITPMAVPIGPDIRLLGFERTVGISSTTATFLTGAIEPVDALANLQAALAPSPTYTVTPSTRQKARSPSVASTPNRRRCRASLPGWTVEASAVDQLGIVRIKRSDYSFDKVVPTFADLPTSLQTAGPHLRRHRRDVGGVFEQHRVRVRSRLAGRLSRPSHTARLRHRERPRRGRRQPSRRC